MPSRFTEWLKKKFRFGPDFDGILDDVNFDDESYPAIATSFRQTGRLPRASAISGVLSRFHSKDWLFHGGDFHRNFEDSERKWAQNDRYAAKDIQCGHYFGCSTRATEAEAKAYRMDRNRYRFFESEMTLDGILDLTYEENIDWLLPQIFENSELLGTSYFNKLIELLNHQKGGDLVNSFAGYIARRDGYDGIRFFGARALREYDTSWQMNPEDPLIYAIERMAFPRMRENPDLQNVVLFSGALTSRKVQRYRVDGGAWQANPLFDIPETELDRVLRYPGAFQEERLQDYLIVRTKLVEGRGEPIVFQEDD